MLNVRVMPCLLLDGSKLVKTVKFDNPSYVGDPVNTIRIFNEKEVDELILLDISATVEQRSPNLKLLSDIASECFMPMTYGGGINNLDDMKRVFGLGVEKIAINSHAFENHGFIKKAAHVFGNQSIVASIDVKRTTLGGYEVFIRGGKVGTGAEAFAHARAMEEMGVGEILLTSMDRDGTMGGYDLELIRGVSDAVRVPLVACGGAGSVEDMSRAVAAGASAVAAGSLVVYQGRNRGVLINFPTQEELRALVTRGQ